MERPLLLVALPTARLMGALAMCMARRRVIRRENNLVRAQGMRKARQWDLLAGVQGREKRFELRLVRMIRNVTGIKQLHRKFAPFVLIQTAQSRGVKLVVQQ